MDSLLDLNFFKTIPNAFPGSFPDSLFEKFVTSSSSYSASNKFVEVIEVGEERCAPNITGGAMKSAKLHADSAIPKEWVASLVGNLLLVLVIP